jgi:hypothetical protein
MKNKTIEKIFNRLTPEKREELKQKRLDHKQSLSAEFQFGYYVGEYIVNNYLPTLSTDHITSKNVIQISKEDTEEYNKLFEAWRNATEYGKDPNTINAEEKWNKHITNIHKLKNKYLPNPLKCFIPILNIQNETEFKQGLINSLWNCDICSYNIDPENIKIYDDENFHFTIIEFKLI